MYDTARVHYEVTSQLRRFPLVATPRPDRTHVVGDSPAFGLVQSRRAGEQRGGVAICAHAQQHQVKRGSPPLGVYREEFA